MAQRELPDGIWLVVNSGGERFEIPMPLPVLDTSAAAEAIRGLDAEMLWAKALAGADMRTSPSVMFLELVALSIE